MHGKGWQPYINQLKGMDYCANLEASRAPEIDNLADIKLKLTCTNSIVAINIYLYEVADEVPSCHGAKGDGWIAR